MTDKEKIEECVIELEYALANKFMTEPVRKILSDTKNTLKTIKIENASG
jgi:hypothetical protein